MNVLQYTFPTGQRIEITTGDITQEKVDAIVNAANARLQHGGGVAAAISHQGGPIIQQESDEWVRRQGPIDHGQPAYTSAGNLLATYVIHAVGPIWGEGNEDEKLAAAIQGCLELAERLGIRSIAFPAISTGIFGFPKQRAAHIFFHIIQDYLHAHPNAHLALIRLTLFDNATQMAFQQAFEQWQTSLGDAAQA